MKLLKKAVSVLLTLTMVLTLFTIIPVPVSAYSADVEYVDRNGKTQTVNATWLLHSETELTPGWYAAMTDVEFADIITLKQGGSDESDINIILGDGVTLSLTNEVYGFFSTESVNLNIYAQSGGTGTIKSNGGDFVYLNGISSNLNLYGGRLIGPGDGGFSEISVSGEINVIGGAVEKTDMLGYGGIYINGGTVSTDYMMSNGTITVSGGTVTAGGSGDYYGMESPDGSIRFEGGNVTVNGNGIYASNSITFNLRDDASRVMSKGYDGSVYTEWYLTDDTNVYNIGEISNPSALNNKTLRQAGHTHTYNAPEWTWDGYEKATAVFTCTACGETVIRTAEGDAITSAITVEPTATATGLRVYTATVVVDTVEYTNSITRTIHEGNHTYGAPQWEWNGYESATLTLVCSVDGEVTVVDAEITYEDTVKATSKTEGTRVYTATATVQGKQYTSTKSETIPRVKNTAEVTYRDLSDKDVTVEAEVIFDDTDVLEDGWYAVTANRMITVRLNCTGNVNLILADGATLSAMKGINVADGATLTVWGQEKGTGTLKAGNVANGACIGTSKDMNTDGAAVTINLNGGTYTLTAGEDAPAIGCYKNHSGVITVNKGTIEPSDTAAINTVPLIGFWGNSTGSDSTYTVNIKGGEINAGTVSNTVAIGCMYGKKNTVNISGGSINASVKVAGTAIGSYQVDETDIDISGGTVNVTCSNSSSSDIIGIGSYYENNTTKITLSWRTLTGCQVYSDSYRDNINLLRTFKDQDGTVYAVGETPAGNIQGKTLTPYCSHVFSEPLWQWNTDSEPFTATASVICQDCATTETFNATVTSEENLTDRTYTGTVVIHGVTYTDVCPVMGSVNVGLYVGGMQVTGANRNDILGNGTASYEPDSNTLTLNNAHITVSQFNDASAYGIYYNEERDIPFRIILRGENTIESDYMLMGSDTIGEVGIFLDKTAPECTISGSGSLVLDMPGGSDAQPVKGIVSGTPLTLNKAKVTWEYKGDYTAYGISLLKGSSGNDPSLTLINGAEVNLDLNGGTDSRALESEYIATLDVDETSSFSVSVPKYALGVLVVPSKRTAAQGAAYKHYNSGTDWRSWDGTGTLSSFCAIHIPDDINEYYVSIGAYASPYGSANIGQSIYKARDAVKINTYPQSGCGFAYMVVHVDNALIDDFTVYDNTFTMPASDVRVEPVFLPIVDAVEPSIDDDGEYIPGTARHYEEDGKNYAILANGCRGEELSSLELSYFTFQNIDDSTCRIVKYTGPTDGLTEIVFPKTYQGRKVTELGMGGTTPLLKCSNSLTLVLNENIRRFNNCAFSEVNVVEITGDTSSLDYFGWASLRVVNWVSRLDIKLDHIGSVYFYGSSLYFRSVTLHLKHGTTITRDSDSGETSLTYDFSGDAENHTYDAPRKPIWSWSPDLSEAHLSFKCKDARCGALDTVDAVVTSATSGDNTVYTARGTYQGTTYSETFTRVGRTEPFIDDAGDYKPGAVAHYASVEDGLCYAVKDDGTIGEKLDSIELSYFTFQTLSADTCRINAYTGSTDGLTELVFPKTYQGRKVTELGMGGTTPMLKCSNSLTLVLNENITRFNASAFEHVNIVKITGDTSSLKHFGYYSFYEGFAYYPLDVKLDYIGSVYFDNSSLLGRYVTLHLKHGTTIRKSDFGSRESRLSYDITGEHVYGDSPEPFWVWSDDNSAATATFTCTDERCKHNEVIDATVTGEVRGSNHDLTATVELGGKTYTSKRTVVGHVFGEPVWTWSEDHTSAHAVIDCILGCDGAHYEADATDIMMTFTDNGFVYTATAELNGTTYTDTVTVPCGTEEEPFLIHNKSDWDAFAGYINNGQGTRAYYKLADDFDNSEAITAVVGTKDHPFAGHFDGNGKTLNVALNGPSDVAPFGYIKDAEIRNLTVSGTVNGGLHSAGLVSFNSGASTITDVTVNVDVTNPSIQGNTHIGGVLGHNQSANITMTNVVYTGTINNKGNYAGGLVGWSDSSTVKLDNCLFKGSYAGTGSFHPVGCTNRTVNTTISQVYYTIAPNFSDDSRILTNSGVLVYADVADNSIYMTVRAADGEDYYMPATVSGLESVYHYTGFEITPEITVKSGDGTPLTEDDYTITFDPATIKEIGEYTLTVTGKGSYAGAYTAIFHVSDHIYSEPTWTWSADKSAANAAFTCEECDHQEVIDAAVTTDYSGDEGHVTTASVQVNGKTYTDSVTVAHTYGEPTWTWSEDKNSVTATFTCTDEKCAHQKTVDATLTGEINGQTCTITATAEFDGAAYTDTAEIALAQALVERAEPYIDADGAYILGHVQHYAVAGKKYAVNEDGSAGDELSSVDLSYFTFTAIGSNYRIDRYTGPTDGLTELVFPKTYNGRKITELATNKTPLLEYTDSLTLVLNENITRFNACAFFEVNVVKITGDTSSLNYFGWLSLSPLHGQGSRLDLELDHIGEVYFALSSLTFRQSVILHLKHGTIITKAWEGTGENSLTYDFTDEHIYGDDPQPTWAWSEDGRTATAIFTCTNEHCKHQETVDAAVVSDISDDAHTFTAKAEFDGKTYTGVLTAAHTYGTPEWRWSDDYSSVALAVTCTACGHERLTDALVIHKLSKGQHVYTAYLILDGEPYIDSEIGSHRYGEPEWTWSEDYSAATATFTCNAPGGSHQSTVDATVTSETVAEGIVYTVTAVFDGKTYTKTFTVAHGDAGDPFLIHNKSDWDAFAADINAGKHTISYYKLADDFDNSKAITTPFGTKDHPFAGHFDGNGKTLNVALYDTANVIAPFCYIQDAEIKKLTVSGTVNGGLHSAGLVGFNNGTSTITDVTVNVDVTNPGIQGNTHIGGVLGHNQSANITMTNVVCTGTINNKGNYAGGLVGWSDRSTVKLDNCLFKGSYAGTGSFHPVGCTNSVVNVTLDQVYYTVKPNYTDNTRILTNGGVLVYNDVADNSIYMTVRAADGEDYYMPATVSGLESTYHYTGEEIAPEITVKSGDGTTLTEDDYTITCDPATIKEIGEYTLTVSGKGSYAGTYTATFNVAGHTYGEPEWTWSADKSAATAAFTCSLCGEQETVDAAVTADHSGDEGHVNIATAEFGGKTYTDSVVLDAHTYGEPSWMWSEDKNSATAIFTCTDEKCAHQKAVDATLTGEINGQTCTITATAVLDGAAYTDTAEIALAQTLVEKGEPYIDADGAYILGHVQHYAVADKNYAVNEDGSAGDELGSVDLSYFTFTAIGNDYRIDRYTGPTDGLTELVIPKTYNGRKITRLGDSINKLFEYSGEFELVLNENIQIIDYSAFYQLDLTKITGDTSSLNHFEWFSLRGGTPNLSLDIKLDHIGPVHFEAMSLLYRNVTLHLKHGTIITKAREGTSENSLAYDFTDEHIYGEPEWTWSEDGSAATATFTCTDDRCKHQEAVTATVTGAPGTDSVTYTATAEFNGREYTDTKTVEVKKIFVHHSLSLRGDIAVNFYLDLTDEQAQNAVVDFSWIVNGTEKTHSVTLSAENKTANGYLATAPVAVAEMTYDITATVTVNGEQLETDVYSVKRYADTILSDEYKPKYLAAGHTEEEYEKLITLIKTMLDYGTKAQVQFVRNTNYLANQGVDYTMQSVTADMITTSPSDMREGLEDYGLEYAGSTIVYLTKTSMRHYYKIVDQEKFDLIKDNVTFNGDPVGYTERNGQIYFEHADIAADALDTLFTFKIGESEYQYSALDYVRDCLNSTNVSYETKQLVSATYWYNQAANAYFGR